ncbi:MAG: Ig-like domain-containing protein, partial [Pirellulales bacterium]|nr:Ig-like domain-containing protein [Pirellulales bacterium]
TAFSTAEETASITVTAVNDAPVLDNTGSPTLTSVTEDDTTNSGDLVSAVLGSSVTDVDSGALEGLAVTAVSANGTWQYSTDAGSTWTNVGTVSGTSALLLRATDKLRLVPDQQNAETATITYRAWDQTSGTQGTKVDVSTNGTTTAFSTAEETASITVTAVNDPPTLSGIDNVTFSDTTVGSAQVIDSNVTSLTDVDSVDFNGGNLTITWSAGGTTDDQLGIRNEGTGSGQISVASNSVSYEGNVIGTISATNNGVNGANLTIDFTTTAATLAAVKALVENVTFHSTASTPTISRTASITVDDGDGGASTSAAATSTITVTGTASISTSDADAAEPANDGQFTVTLSVVPGTDTVVNYSVTGTANHGTDFATLSGSVTVLAGQSTATLDVDVTDDAFPEPAETVIVTLDSTDNAGIAVHGTNNSATVTITDDDGATVSIAATDAAAAEPADDGQFTVTLSAAADTDTVVNYTASGTASGGTDYATFSGSVTITAGSTTATIDVDVTDDAFPEPAETVIVTLDSTDNAGIAVHGTNNSATVTITDDDGATVSIAATDASAAEPADDGQFTVTLSAAADTDTVVNYTASGTASGGTDYATFSGSVTITAGSTTATIDVDVTDDAFPEPAETVIVTLDSTDNAGIAVHGTNNSATVTITDDGLDAATVSIVSNDTIAAEPSNDGQFTVTLSTVHPNDLVVNYTVTGTANHGIDFAMLSGSLTVPAGNITGTIDVRVVDDAYPEDLETVRLTLTSTDRPATSVDPAQNTAVVTIIDDPGDAATISVVVTDGTATEPDDNAELLIVLGAAADTDTVVSYSLSGNADILGVNAVPGHDFVALSGTVVIPSFTTSVPITIDVIDDSLIETDESLTLQVISSDNAQLAPDSDTGAGLFTIRSEDSGHVLPVNINNLADGRVLTGTGEPGATIQVLDENGDLPSGLSLVTTVDENGNWILNSATFEVQDGQTLTTIQVDSDGNSLRQTEVVLVEDGTAALDTLAPFDPNVNFTQTAGRLSGTGLPASSITLYDDDGHYLAGPTVTNADGNWSIDGVIGFSGGDVVTVISTDPAGNSRGATKTILVGDENSSPPVDWRAPNQATINSTQGLPNEEGIGTAHELDGGADPGTRVELYNAAGALIAGPGETTANGHWRFTNIPAGITHGELITAITFNVAGNSRGVTVPAVVSAFGFDAFNNFSLQETLSKTTSNSESSIIEDVSDSLITEEPFGDATQGLSIDQPHVVSAQGHLSSFVPRSLISSASAFSSYQLVFSADQISNSPLTTFHGEDQNQLQLY